MNQRDLAQKLNGRLVDLYRDFADSGITMEIYFKMLASHAAALIVFQPDPPFVAQAFCGDVMAGLETGILHAKNVRGRRPPL